MVGEIISSLSQLLKNTLNLSDFMAAIFNLQDNDVEYMYCFIAFFDSENGLAVCIGEIIVYQLLTTI